MRRVLIVLALLLHCNQEMCTTNPGPHQIQYPSQQPETDPDFDSPLLEVYESEYFHEVMERAQYFYGDDFDVRELIY